MKFFPLKVRERINETLGALRYQPRVAKGTLAVLGALFTLFAFAPSSFAADIGSQTTHSVSMNGVVINNLMQQCVVVTPHSANLDTFAYYVDGRGAAPNVQSNVQTYTSSNCGSGLVAQAFGATHNAVGTNDTFTDDFSSASLSLSSVNSILVRVDRVGGGFANPLGSYGDGTTFYYLLTDDVPSDISTRWISLGEPISGTTTASSSVHFSAQYYYNNSTHNFDTIKFEVLREDAYFEAHDIDGLSIADGQHTAQADATLPAGAYVWRAVMYNASTSAAVYSSFQSFNVLSNPYPNAIGTSSPSGAYSLATSTCSITNVTGCFQNALLFVFYPSQSILDNFTALGDVAQTRIPFSYFYEIKNIIDTASIAATSSALNVSLAGVGFNLGSATFLDPSMPILAPFKAVTDTLFDVVVWVVFALAIWLTIKALRV